MYPRYRVAFIIGVCIAVIFLTTGLLSLFNPDIAAFSAGPSQSFFGSGGSSGASNNTGLGPGVGADGQTPGLISSLLFDDIGEATAAPPTATPYLAAEAAPYGNVAQLLIEPTLISSSSRPSTATPNSNSVAPNATKAPAGPDTIAGNNAPTDVSPSDTTAPQSASAADNQHSSSSSGSNGINRTATATGSSSASAPAASATPRQNTATPVANVPVGTTPTKTAVPPTKTAVPPTNTVVPPTKTPLPPTDTPEPPTKTPLPTKTPKPPTPEPPTPEPPTSEPPTKEPPTSEPPTKEPPTPEPPTPEPPTPEPPTKEPPTSEPPTKEPATPEPPAPNKEPPLCNLLPVCP